MLYGVVYASCGLLGPRANVSFGGLLSRPAFSCASTFTDSLGMRGAKTRFWGAAALGDIHGRGSDGSGKKRLTIVGNPSKVCKGATFSACCCVGQCIHSGNTK